MDDIVVVGVIILAIPFVFFLFCLLYIKSKLSSDIRNLGAEINKLEEKIDKLSINTQLVEKECQKQDEKVVVEAPIVTVPEKEQDVPIKTPLYRDLRVTTDAEAIKEVEKTAAPIIEQLEDVPVVSSHIVESTPEVAEEIEEIIIPPFSPVVVPEEIPKENKNKGKTDFEKYIGENILSKIGIATLVLGIGYFVKYAIDQNWINEIGRVAIGILCGALLIGVANKLKQSYRTFSSILVGGGISVLYITVSLAFWEYQLFSQALSFVFLILITILSVFLSIIYDRKELAIFSLLGGFASPLMVSSGSGNYIVLFSYILILNTGMLILAFKKQWKLLEVISFILTLIFYWVWIFTSYEENEKTGALIFGFLFFIQFYLLALIDYFKRKGKIAVFQVILILANNLSLYGTALYIIDDYKGYITIVMALLNAIPMYILFRRETIDKNMLYLLIAIVLSFVSLAIPVQLNGCVITMFWAVETAVLLWLYQKSSINIFKTGFLLIQALVLISLGMDWYADYFSVGSYPEIVFNNTFITGLVVTATVWLNTWLLNKTELDFSVSGYTKKQLSRLLKVIGIILVFFTLYLELRAQMNSVFDSGAFINSILGLYFYAFVAILAYIRWKKTVWINGFYMGLLLSVLVFASYYMYIVYDMREDVLAALLSSWSYFAIHYLVYPFIAFIYAFLIKKKGQVSINGFNPDIIYWLLTIATVVVLSLETDNTTFMLFAQSEIPYYELMSYSHTIAYPILWGILSFMLMAWGMKEKNRSLRIISLTLFILIIAKLYLYDIWTMNQTGRIIAFIFLGLLFLLVSFLYQKLKILIKKEDE